MAMINNIFAQNSDRVVAYKGNDPVTLYSLLDDIYKLCRALDDNDRQRWILLAHDPLNFLCAFYALMIKGKDILLPPNQQAGTIAEFVSAPDAVITDLQYSAVLPAIAIAEELGSSRATQPAGFHAIDTSRVYVELYTSGSEGEPKKIRKQVATLEKEIQCLDGLWGERVQDSIFVSTVSHQHIYGLLFRVLWPLCGGYRFIARNIEYPEQLDSVVRQLGSISLVSSPAYLKRMVEVLDKLHLAEHLKIIFSSGGPLDRLTAEACQASLGQTPVEVLGSTETGGVAYRQQINANDIWQKMPPVSIRQNSANEALEVRSPFCFTQDWYCMGDRVEIVSDTEFRLLGRLDRIVKLEEKRISLDQMEAYLRQDNYVTDVRVIPVAGRRTVLGVACILSEQGRQMLAKDGKKHLSTHFRRQLLHIYEPVTLPRKWRYIEEFPYNSQGKLTRQALLALFENAHDEQT